MAVTVKNLRLSDLARRRRGSNLELLSVRLPVQLLARIDALVARFGSGKAELVVALLNEGLECYRREGRARGRSA